MRLVLIVAVVLNTAGVQPPQDSLNRDVVLAREMIRQQRYNDAINRLEQVLESKAEHPDALCLMGAAVLYSKRDYLGAQKLFEKSFAAGGGAAFWVSHSHESLGTDELADYCRGWLYVNKGGVEYAPESSDHAFRLSFSELKEFKQNRFAKRLFHIKDTNKTYNFRPRTGEEGEVLLVLALYKKFSR